MIVLMYQKAAALVAFGIIMGVVSTVSAQARKPCAAGWVLVPGDSSLGTSDFCVMEFEAQNPLWSTYQSQIVDLGVSAEPRFQVPAGFTAAQPVSQYGTATEQRIPWVYITQPQAAAACASVGAHLVTIAEAQTINRNVETQNSNWPHGIGQQCMYAGHVDGDPLSFALAPTGDDQHNDPYQSMNENEGNVAQGAGRCPFVLSDYTTNPATLRDNGIYSRRTLYLSTGATLWDWSGNVGEWLAGTCTNNGNGYGASAIFPSSGAGNGGTYFDYNPQDHIGAAYAEWTQPYLADYESVILGPRNPLLAGSAALNSNWGVGKYWGCFANGFAMYRGGYAFKGSNGGVFHLDAGHTNNFNHNYVGFRCATGLAPTISADPATVPSGSRTTIKWNAPAGSSCTYASPTNSPTDYPYGPVPPVGGQTGVGPLVQNATYMISCNGESASVNVSVTAASSIAPSVSSTLSASLTVNGTKDISVNIGDYITFNWSSKNAATAKSTITSNSPDRCKGKLAFPATKGSGFFRFGPVGACRAGHTYTVTYTVTDSSGQQTSASAIIRVRSASASADVSAFTAGVLSAVQSILLQISDILQKSDR